MRCLAILLLALLAGGGCATVDSSSSPSFGRDAGVPQSPAPETTKRVDPALGWSAIVGNPDLASWIRVALDDAPSLDGTRASLRVAAAETRAARSEGRPAVDARVDVRAGRRRNAMTRGKTTDVESLSAAVSATWELDVFGRIRATVGAAELAELAGDHALLDRELEMAAEIAERYVQGSYHVDSRRLRQKALASRNAVVRYHESRLEAGLVRPETLDRAVADRLQAERRLEDANEALSALSARWQYLVPERAGASPLESLPGLSLTDTPSLPDPATLHARVLRRPDVHASHALWVKAQELTKQANRARLPSLSAVGMAEGDGPSPVEEPEEWVAWAGIRLSLPVLSPQRASAATVQREETKVRAALYDEAVKLALFELRDAYVAGLHAEKRLSAAVAEAARFRMALESATRQFEKGLVPVLTVETARLAWLDAEERRLKLRAAVLERHIDLLRASGGESAD
jgi:multidrug efflux system outer membrane protein